ncbi:hypothetical protein [Acidaminococcus massiliensis]|jgi:hypothetical protein|uniref:hypothetical protein n=1 Tax=Acidaminococcus massiliensis TaxID=1852375 RepID=UPI002046698F|nr:hypothetical protein [Acidaminococcus massiliensis]DAR24902.1 MAG TPA: virion morphogenesis protein [Caudoviricetes sp.]
MIVEIDLKDQISPAIQKALKTNEKWLRWASKSVGWYAQKRIKEEVATGSPGGESYEERLPRGARKALSTTAPKMWYGKLRNAIGYEYDNGVVRIGWTSRTSSIEGKKQEEGFIRNVTPTLRAWWAKAAQDSKGKLINLSSGKDEIEVPARPVFEPVQKKLEAEIGPYVEQKVEKYIKENEDYGKKNVVKRKYKVYG